MSGWLPGGSTHWGGRPVARTVSEAGPRQRVVLSGTLTSVAARHHRVLGGPVRPADPRPSLEAELDDGTGAITLRWLGREAVPGIAVGTALTAEGTVLVEHGRNLVLNPITSFLD